MTFMESLVEILVCWGDMLCFLKIFKMQNIGLINNLWKQGTLGNVRYVFKFLVDIYVN